MPLHTPRRACWLVVLILLIILVLILILMLMLMLMLILMLMLMLTLKLMLLAPILILALGAQAGVSGIMIHSKQKQPDEILEFIKKYRESGVEGGPRCSRDRAEMAPVTGIEPRWH